MKTKFSTNWKSSTQPRKQRKYRYNAPKHIKGKNLGSHLTQDLRKKYGKRSVRIRTGDKVKIMRGQFRGKTGKVEKVNVKTEKVFISNIAIEKRDGTKVAYPIHASNLMITELNLQDKRRTDILKRK
ncbi:50S ribosomal protein L24 [Candidatus Woesearchaeota archaeon]|nr:50S ribosomal protein L24 [Candidatus Woesearchaeota archaeon]